MNGIKILTVDHKRQGVICYVLKFKGAKWYKPYSSVVQTIICPINYPD